MGNIWQIIEFRISGGFNRARGISLSKIAYEISAISEIPNNSTGIPGFPDRSIRDFQNFRDFPGISNVSKHSNKLCVHSNKLCMANMGLRKKMPLKTL